MRVQKKVMRTMRIVADAPVTGIVTVTVQPS